MYKINSILETKDGRMIGNAIITDRNKDVASVITDYGNKLNLTDSEIDEFFHVRIQSKEEIRQRGYHKYYNKLYTGEENEKSKRKERE